MKKHTTRRILKTLRLLADSVLPILFWLSLIFGFDAPYIAVLTVICAIAHELGHIAAIYLFTENAARITGHSSGFRIKRDSTLSYKKEIMILLAGPSVNLGLFLFAFPFRNALDGYIGIFALINLVTALSNLMPFEGYDGYGAICEILRANGGADHIRILESFSFFLTVAITFISLYLIDRFSEGYWIFGIFFVMLLSKLVSFGKYDIFKE